MQSILVSIFRLGLLRLSAGTYVATFSTAANVVEMATAPRTRPRAVVGAPHRAAQRGN